MGIGGFLKALFTNRRGYAFMIPILTITFQQLGLGASDTQINDLLDKGAALMSGLLSLWSLRSPKP
jgi:hypothetical protein